MPSDSGSKPHMRSQPRCWPGLSFSEGLNRDRGFASKMVHSTETAGQVAGKLLSLGRRPRLLTTGTSTQAASVSSQHGSQLPPERTIRKKAEAVMSSVITCGSGTLSLLPHCIH